MPVVLADIGVGLGGVVSNNAATACRPSSIPEHTRQGLGVVGDKASSQALDARASMGTALRSASASTR
jgi:hypothetical protein